MELEKELTGIKAKREILKGLSAEVADLVKAGDFSNVNEAIMTIFYKKDGHNEFNTYKQWKEKGYQVKKGAKAYLLWAKPLSAQKPVEESAETDNKRDYFPICFLFSNMQVDKVEE